MHIRWEIDYIVSTHSRPKAAAMEIPLTARVDDVSTHSRPKAAAKEQIKQKIAELFQHTAARRRLLAYGFITPDDLASFNTQPPEGGCTRCGLLAN